MSRRKPSEKIRILLGTTNPGKIKQFHEVLKELKWLDTFKSLEFVDLSEVGSDPIMVKESGYTFEENAVRKAASYGRRYMMPCISDDGGLVVPALNYRPGLHSHREGWTARKVLQELKASDDRMATLRCTMALYDPSTDCYATHSEALTGEVARTVSRGVAYGYDGIFIPSQAGLAPLGSKATVSRLLRTKGMTRLSLSYPRAVCLLKILGNLNTRNRIHL